MDKSIKKLAEYIFYESLKDRHEISSVDSHILFDGDKVKIIHREMLDKPLYVPNAYNGNREDDIRYIIVSMHKNGTMISEENKILDTLTKYQSNKLYKEWKVE